MSTWHEDCGRTQISSNNLPSHPATLRSAHHPPHRVALGEGCPSAPWSGEIRRKSAEGYAPELESRNEIEVANGVGREHRGHGAVTPRGTDLHAALGGEKGRRGGDEERRRSERGEKDVATRPVGFRRTKRTRQGCRRGVAGRVARLIRAPLSHSWGDLFRYSTACKARRVRRVTTRRL